MGFDQSVAEPLDPIDQTHLAWKITVHSLCDLSYISPVVFLYLLKECYICGMSPCFLRCIMYVEVLLFCCTPSLVMCVSYILFKFFFLSAYMKCKALSCFDCFDSHVNLFSSMIQDLMKCKKEEEKCSN